MLRKKLWVMAVGVACMVAGSVATGEDKAAAKKEIPAPVLAALSKDYPGATLRKHTTGQRDGKLLFGLETVEAGKTRELLYTAEGSLVALEESLAPQEVPEAVLKAIRNGHPDTTINKARKLATSTAVQYEVVVKSGKKSVEILLDPDGKVLSDSSK